MIKKYFGTDGLRGIVGKSPITPTFFLKIGYSLGKLLNELNTKNLKNTVIIARDTRVSGDMLCCALKTGLTAYGFNVSELGIASTPCVSYLTKKLKMKCGLMVSASHNNFKDNGLKIFDSDGNKFSSKLERSIEEKLSFEIKLKSPKEIGQVFKEEPLIAEYQDFCKKSVKKNLDYNKIKVVLDCANGSNYKIAFNIFSNLGCQVELIGNRPTGLNINKNCGSLYPKSLVKKVIEIKADMGIGFDGDGDRLVIVDETGKVYDGDEILYIIAKYRKERKKIQKGVVGTLMSNFALELKLKEMGLEFSRTKVGDKYILEELLKNEWNLGGENSGHIIILDKHMTGDGILTSLEILEVMLSKNKKLSDLRDNFQLLPQKLTNILIDKEYNLDSNLKSIYLRKIIKDFSKDARILIRKSGTEPLIRVMVESKSQKINDNISRIISQELKKNISSHE